MRLLLVEDEIQLAEALQAILSHNQYRVDVAYDGASGLEQALNKPYDALILDIMLPRLNGWEVLRQLREAKIAVPVLMLTAKAEVQDRVKGLDLGADDYLPKPFAAPELLARLRAITRRQGPLLQNHQLPGGDLTLDPIRFALAGPQGSVTLSAKEMEICRYLLQRYGQVVDKNELIARGWGYDSEVEFNNLEVYLSMLRKKLAFIGSQVMINAVRGVGYRLEVPPACSKS